MTLTIERDSTTGLVYVLDRTAGVGGREITNMFGPVEDWSDYPSTMKDAVEWMAHNSKDELLPGDLAYANDPSRVWEPLPPPSYARTVQIQMRVDVDAEEMDGIYGVGGWGEKDINDQAIYDVGEILRDDGVDPAYCTVKTDEEMQQESPAHRFQMWDTESRNMIDEFETVGAAIAAVLAMVKLNPGVYPDKLTILDVRGA